MVDICRNQTAGYGLILKIGRSVQRRDLTPSSEQVKAAVDNGARVGATLSVLDLWRESQVPFLPL